MLKLTNKGTVLYMERDKQGRISIIIGDTDNKGEEGIDLTKAETIELENWMMISYVNQRTQ